LYTPHLCTPHRHPLPPTVRTRTHCHLPVLPRAALRTCARIHPVAPAQLRAHACRLLAHCFPLDDHNVTHALHTRFAGVPIRECADSYRVCSGCTGRGGLVLSDSRVCPQPNISIRASTPLPRPFPISQWMSPMIFSWSRRAFGRTASRWSALPEGEWN
jgi:hypothetical protein